MNDVTLKRPELPVSLNDLGTQIDREIRLFLDGESDGGELLRGLYGSVIDEPVPASLTALLRL